MYTYLFSDTSQWMIRRSQQYELYPILTGVVWIQPVMDNLASALITQLDDNLSPQSWVDYLITLQSIMESFKSTFTKIFLILFAP